MMETARRFSRNEPLKQSMDFNYLKEKGLKYIQQLSGGIWTDYNSHDPGVTILEQLCYALTDLAYRTEYDVEDLLTVAKGKPIDAKNNSFFSPRMIFSRHPVTLNDFRKLLIDRFQEIQNVWIVPEALYDREEGVTGVNNMEIMPSLPFQKAVQSDPENETRLLYKIRHFLNKHRSLGEDFGSLTLLKPEPFKLEAHIKISTEEDPEEVFAAILFGLEVFLYHPVSFSSIDELMGEGMGLEEIYSGPRLNSGFIKEDKLKPRNKSLSTDQILRILTQIKGVERCWKISINPNPEEKDLKVSPGRYASLNFEDSEDGIFNSIRLFLNGNRVYPDKDKANNLRLELWSKNFRYHKLDQVREEYFEKMLLGRFRNPEKYTSIQHQFPLIYGIGMEGISRHNSPERKAMVKQLKAFLLFFEQHLANHLSQLAHLNSLFSIDKLEHAKTYYAQRIESVVGYHELEIPTAIDPSLITSNPFEASPYTLETERVFLDRKNRLFDHLLARFGEKIDDFPLMIALKLNLIPTETATKRRLLERKSAFLVALEDVSYNQSKGEFFGKEKEDFAHCSGLEQILLIKTGIPQRSAPLIPNEFSRQNGGKKGNKKSGTAQLDLNEFRAGYRFLAEAEKTPTKTDSAEGGFSGNIFGEIGIKTLMKNAVDYKKYMLSKPLTKNDDVEVIFQKGSNKWVRIFKDLKESEAVRKINQLIANFRELNLRAEGLYLVDHILLRDFLENSLLGFCLLNRKGENTFQSRWVKTEAERLSLLNEFYTYSTERDSFKLEGNTVVVRNPSNRTLATYDLGTKPSAPKQGLEDLLLDTREFSLLMNGTEEQKGRLSLQEIELIRLEGTMGSDGPTYQRRCVLNRKKDGMDIVSEDFFDHQVSICLPDWPARFQDLNFRDYFENLVHERIPVHLQANIFWLNYNQFDLFERTYLAWRKLKSTSEKEDLGKLKHLSSALYSLLTEWKGGIGK